MAIEQKNKIGATKTLIKYNPFCYSVSKSHFWFRIFGYGLKGRNTRITEPLFSERNGHQKRVIIWGWSIGILTTDGI
jgi:hypothetical protein